MRQGTTQFLYCCPDHFTKQFRLVSKSIKKQKGNLLTLTEDPDFSMGWVKATPWGFHKKCLGKHVNTANVYRCTITYEVP